MTDRRRIDLAQLAHELGLVSKQQLLETWANHLSGEACAELEHRLGWAPTPEPPSTPAIGPAEARKALEILDADDEDEDFADDDRYARLQMHAPGGMGVVWRARDERMGRLVALKELQPRFDDQPALRARFLAEARITGQLEHPGVVPVYEVVEPEDQPPFYTMRLVQGATLSEAVREFHGRQGGPTVGVELRDLLGAFVSVCNTLAYAHSRGVVHRDLKGSNVVLGPFGEVVVLDWGLAKMVAGAAGDGEETTIEPLRNGVVEPTEQGRLGGTPEYMSPEQARGEAGAIDARTDVFGLGSVLYQILTGKPPYQAATKDETVALAPEGRIHSPRQSWPGVPAALEAVCLKALAKAPGDRYESAAALGQEVKQWLADEPVKAYRDPLRERGRRWGRRHRTLVTAAGVLLTATVVWLASGLWVVGREKAETAKQRDEAEANLEQAIAAVDKCFGLAKDDPALQADNLRQVRQLLLSKTLPFYRDFSRKAGADREVRARQAEYLFRAGFITQDIATAPEAVALYEEAAAIQRRLCEEDPEDAARQTALARTLNSLAILQRRLGKQTEALASYRQARDIQQRLSEAHPDVAEHQADLAVAWNNLAVLHIRTGEPTEAMACMARARDIRVKLTAAHPKVERYQADLAQTWHNLGAMLAQTSRLPEAIPCAERAVEAWGKLSEANPKVGRYKSWQSQAWNNLAILQGYAGNQHEARKSYHRGGELQRRLTKEHPEVAEYRSALATTLINLGLSHGEAGEREDARRCYGEAIDLLRQLHKADPGVKEHRFELAQALNNLGPVLVALGEKAEARKSYAEARATWEALRKEHPTVPAYAAGVASTWINEGNLDAKEGGHSKALQAADRAVELLNVARKSEPNNPMFRSYLISARVLRANTLGDTGRKREAIAAWDEAIKLNGNPADVVLFRRSRARALVLAGDHRLAMAEVEALAAGPLPAQQQYELAGIAALCAAAAGRDASRPLPERAKEAEARARRAVELLGQAARAGQFEDAGKLAALDADADLAFLRDREDYRVFVESLPVGDP